MARLHHGINKRLFKELNEITDTPQVAAYYLNSKVNKEEGDVELHFVIFPYEKRICRLTLKIPSCWPFRPPSCYITNNLHEKIGDYIESVGSIPLKDNKCCCCSSLLCSNNWHCQCKLLDFMLEFQKNYTIRKNLITIFICNSISRNKLGNNSHSFIKYNLIAQYLLLPVE